MIELKAERVPSPGLAAGCVPLTANMDVFGDVKICPGVYMLDDPERPNAIALSPMNGGLLLMDGIDAFAHNTHGVDVEGGDDLR